jgi:hypothetical protein
MEDREEEEGHRIDGWADWNLQHAIWSVGPRVTRSSRVTRRVFPADFELDGFLSAAVGEVVSMEPEYRNGGHGIVAFGG